MWTHFWDMHSGGGLKEPYNHIYIEAPEQEAIVIFYNRFGHNPHRVSCTCCGEDYAVDSDESLLQLTGHHRGCRFDVKTSKYIEGPRPNESYKSLAEYKKDPSVLMISKEDIKPEERHGSVPDQGYVWV